MRADAKTYTRSSGYAALFRSSKGWNGFARRFRGGPLLLSKPRVAGRRDVRGRSCRAGSRVRSRAGCGDPRHGRPRIPSGTAPGTLRGRGCRPTDPELAKVHDREELAILVAKEMAVRPAASK